ncbi:hypothetical protein [Timonella sp. A28]|uniref:hypothetical protein n=1 Tax=Timonella sp. A28 TaxID=3442640 RepID=UPI003EC1256C
MTSQNPQGQTPLPPPLPPQDPGIPHKWARPSIRERGLIIAILVISILGLINFNINVGGYNGYSGVYNAVQQAMNDHAFNNGMYDDSSGFVYNSYDGTYVQRTPAQAIKTDAGVVVFAILVNSGTRTVSGYDVSFTTTNTSVQGKYVSGLVTLAPGEAQPVAVLFPKMKKIDEKFVESFTFETLSTVESSEGDMLDISEIYDHADEELKKMNKAYEPVLREQLKKFQTENK